MLVDVAFCDEDTGRIWDLWSRLLCHQLPKRMDVLHCVDWITLYCSVTL